MRTREEQIEEIIGLCKDAGIVGSPYVAEEIVTEIEQRVRAEIGCDSERLDWLSEDRHGLASHASIGTYVTTESGETYVNDDIRAAIDEARENAND